MTFAERLKPAKVGAQ